MIAFIDAQRSTYGVESVCRYLTDCPVNILAREREHGRHSSRYQRDQMLKPEIERIWNENRQVYSARKVWRQLNHEQISVARCTMERLMNQLLQRQTWLTGNSFVATC